MFAIIKTGGKQYKVAAGDKIAVEKLSGEVGEVISFDEVLMLGDKTGTPLVEGASISGTIVEQTRGDKIIVFKKKRRQNYRRKNGHRQFVTMVEIGDLSGKAPAKKAAAPKVREAAPKTETAKKAAPKKAAAKTESKAAATKAPAKKTAAKKPAAKKATKKEG